jgi:heat-inducible transcriptional repressor
MTVAPANRPADPRRPPVLSPRQAQVLRAVVSGYVGGAAPVGSETISRLLPMNLSSASVRNTLAELAALELVEKPHRSAGRVPTELGFRTYVDQLVAPRDLGEFEQREILMCFEGAGDGAVARVASRLLSERTRQLGFVEAPRLDRVVLRHVSFVRVSSERVLAVLVSQGGGACQRVVHEPGRGDQALLDRMAAAVNERVAGRTLHEVRERLLREAALLRSQADSLLERAVRAALPTGEEGADDDWELVIATRLALLDQPEFHDPERVRELFQAVEARERLAEVLDKVLESGRVQVAFGGEISEPALRHCALVVAPYGRASAPLGALGVIGPRRMDYARVIPLVGYLSQLVTEKIGA